MCNMYFVAIVLKDLDVECGPDTVGAKRKAGQNMDFCDYEICDENGQWKPKLCPEYSAFWSLISCCVHLGRFPMLDNCL